MKLPGWSKLSNAVYQHQDGTRIHVGGLAVLPTGESVWGNSWPESKIMDRSIRMCGGNRRRGVMSWSRHLRPNSVMDGSRPPIADSTDEQGGAR